MQLTWLIGRQLLEASKRIDDWMLRFEGDSTLIIECLWRLVDSTQIVVASFDQGQSSTIWVNRTGSDEIAIVFRDAGQELSRCLYNARIHSAIVRPITNDVQIDFDNGMSLQLVSDRSSCGGWWNRRIQDMHSNWDGLSGIQNRMQRLSVLELRPMESLSSPQQQKHQKMRLLMTAAEEFERNSIDWYVPLPQSNSFVPSQRRLKAESYPVEPSADVCKMPNTQLAR